MARNIKRYFSLMLVLTLFTSICIPTFAVQKTSTVAISDTINLEDSQTTVSEVLTFDEVVKAIAKDNNISKKQAADQVVSSFIDDSEKTPLTGKFAQSTRSAQAMQAAKVAAASATYRNISAEFTVTSTYKATLRFYCQTEEGDYFHAIVKVLNVSMNRNYNGVSKQFGGNVYINLEDPNRIYYVVDGDFYNNGTTTGGGSLKIGLGEGSSLTFNASNTSNFYAYVYKEGHALF